MQLNRIYNEDCLVGLKQITTESIDLVVSDIPYRIVGGGCSNSNKEPKGILNRERAKHINNDGIFDGRSDDVRAGKLFKHNDIEFSEWLPDVYRVLKNGTHCYLMVNARNLKDLQVEAEKVGFAFQQLLVWRKDNLVMNKYYMNQLEFILMLKKGAARNVNDMGISNCLSCPNIIGKGMNEHPCMPAGQLVYINNTWKKIEDIRVGDKSMYGDVVAISAHYAERIVEIKTQNGIVRATYNHPFLILRGNEIAWCEAEQITKNDFLLWNESIKQTHSQQQRGISARREIAKQRWSMLEFGKKLLAKFQRAIKFITLTGIKQTMILPISNLSVPLNTNGYTRVANLCLENGISHAKGAENTRKLMYLIGIFQKRVMLLKDYVKHVIFKSRLRFVRFSLQKVGNVKAIHEKTKVYDMTIDKCPAFDTVIGISHNTAKPIALMEVMIRQSSNVGDVVLDPFAGGGSTLIAAKRLERQYIGFEIDKQYYDMANRRLTQEPQQTTMFN